MVPYRVSEGAPREGRHCCLKSANSHRNGPPEPGILVSVVTCEAMQLRGVSKVATLTWMGNGFGKQPHHPHHRGGAGANP